ncbi:hypothetical protein NX794_19545 [Streptomyces sp. LP11]|uniref:Transposase n=1 Tax=Streptomyces pyxinicus TaxID=2970331 RepID=A0ABT2B4T9_9ACTN|nr:hypothetical protein [Streptomyces sp. LP11]MCS0603391.1 hypothetical protein [Streptomyces sp. LP11]
MTMRWAEHAGLPLAPSVFSASTDRPGSGKKHTPLPQAEYERAR